MLRETGGQPGWAKPAIASPGRPVASLGALNQAPSAGILAASAVIPGAAMDLGWGSWFFWLRL
jgi:hypothetical protein